MESLLAQQSEELEEALWTSLRALEEMAELRRRMAKRALKMGNSQRAQSYTQDAEMAERRAKLIRQAILNSVSDSDKQNAG